MVMSETGHPQADKLTAFALGRLDDAESAEIEAHLADCTVCQQVLEDTPADSLVETLQEPAPAAAAQAAPSAESGPGLFTRLAAVINPNAPQPAPRPSARSHQDVPADLRDHPRYEILERLGAGGMGTVFKARHRLMDRIVALKVMNPQLLADPVAVGRFQREVKAAAQLAHPHIVTAYDAEQVGGLHFLAMEFVEGQTLAEVVDQRGPLPVHRACEYIRQAALGLQYAHQRGMVHRDIKPQNLVLTATGDVKVFDFGLARFVSESGEPGEGSSSGRMLGSPDYMAPEQAKDAHAADIRADIYSLGCTLYHLLAGLPPFPGGSAVEKLAAHLEKKPIEIAKLRLDVSSDLERVVDRMLAKDPQQRFQTPGEVAAALEPFCQPRPAAAPVAQPKSDSLAPVLRGEGWGEGRNRLRRSRRSVGAWAGTLTLLLALGIVGFFYGAAIYRFVTDQGILVIETDDPDVEVVVKQGGREITIVDSKTGREVTLKAGEYQLELAEGRNGLKLSTSEFRLSRAGKQIVRVWLPTKQDPNADVVAAHPQTQPEPPGPTSPESKPSTPTEPSPATPAEIVELRRLLGHRQQVNAVAVSPDGCFLLSGSHDKTLRLWNLASGKEERRFEGHTENILAVVFSPNGRLAASAGGGGLWKDGQRKETDFSIRVWDVETARELRRCTGHTRPVTSLAFTPNGRQLLSGSQDTTLRLWDVADGRQVQLLSGHDGEVLSVAVSPDGKSALSGSADRTLGLWDLETGKLTRRFTGHAAAVRSVAFSPNGKIAFSGAEDRTVRRWNLDNGESVLFSSQGPTLLTPSPFGSSGAHLAAVACVAVSADGRRVLSAGGGPASMTLGTRTARISGTDNRVRLWDAATGQQICFEEGHTKELLCVGFSPDGRFAVSAGLDKTIRVLWLSKAEADAAPGKLAQLALASESPRIPVLVKQQGRLVSALYSTTSSKSTLKPGEYELELADQPEEFRLSADTVTLKPGEQQTLAIRREPLAEKPAPPQLTEIRRFSGHTAGVLSVDISRDGKQALSGGRDKTVRLWDLASGQQLRSQEGVTEEVWGVAFSPDGSRAISGGLGKVVWFWDVTTGKEIRTFTCAGGGCGRVAFSPDGRWALAGSADSKVYLWDAETGHQLRTFSGHESPVFAVAFSPDGRQALSGSWRDVTVRLWDVETGQELRQFEGHTEPISQTVFSPDGRLALTGSADRTMRLWDVATGTLLRIYVHPTGVCSVAISPDGRWAVSGSGSKTTSEGGTTVAGYDYTVRLWDVASGEVLGQAENFTSAIDGVAISPDGRSVLAGCNDGTLRLLRLPEPPSLPITEIRRLSGHTGPVEQVALSSDGRQALSCSQDQTLRLWNVQTGEQIRQFEGDGAKDMARRVALSPDGKLAASSCHCLWKGDQLFVPTDYSIRLWDVDTGREKLRFLGHTKPVYGLAFTPDGRRVLSASDDATLRVWDVQSGRLVRVIQGHDGAIGCLDLSADGRHVVSGAWDNTVRLWDVATGRELRRLEGHTNGIMSVSISPEGRCALSCGFDGTMRLWELTTGRQLRLFPGHRGTVAQVAFSPDGRLAVSGCDDTIVRLWDVASGAELGRFEGLTDFRIGLAFAPDGQSLLACSGDATIRLLKLPEVGDSPKAVVPGDTGQLVLDSEASDGWLLVKQRDKVVLVLDATASQTVDLSVGEYQLELAGRTEGVRLSADRFTLPKGGKQVVQIRPQSKPARVEITDVRSFPAHMSFHCSVALSRDGRRALTGGTNTVRLWDVASGKELRRFDGHTRTVLCVALSPDGRRALSAGGGHWHENQPPSDLDIRLWDTATGQQIGRLQGHTSYIHNLTFSADGHFALSGSSDATARLWNVETGKQVHCFEGGVRFVQSVAMSPDGRWALSAHCDGAARLWDTASGKKLRTFGGESGYGYVWSVAFSPDGNQVLTSGSDRMVRLWIRETGQILRSFLHPTGVYCAAFCPDGRRVVTGGGLRVNSNDSYSWAGYDYRVRIWDVASGREIGSYDGFPGVVDSMAFSADARCLLAVCRTTSARLLWLSETSKPQQPAGSQDAGQLAVEINGFDLPILVKQPDKLVTVIVPKVSKLVELPPGEYELELTGHPEDFRLSADKVTLAKGQTQTVSIQEVPLENPPHEITELRCLTGHTAAVECVVFSSDGLRALSGSQDKTIRLWDLETGETIRQFAENPQHVFGVALSADGKQALSAGSDHANRDFAVRLWGVEDGKEIRRFAGHTDQVWNVIFSPDGNRVLSWSQDGTLRLWDLKTGAELQKLAGHEGGVRWGAFAPDGRRILSGGFDATLRLWDVETGRELNRFDGHTEEIIGLAFSPDGRQAVSSALDRSVRLWDVETGRQIKAFAGCKTSESSVIFTPDGRRIISGGGWRTAPLHAGFDYSVRLRDVAAGRILGSFDGHGGPVVTVAVSPDGRRALSAGHDNMIRLLKLPEPDANQQAALEE